jgi:DNA-binding Lrp family transcriptional regulator
MDSLDFKIIKKIIDNCRVPFSSISNELGVSTETIIRRYNKLKKMGVLKPTVHVDIFKIGYGAVVWYMISLMSNTDKSSIVKEMVKIQDITRIIKAVGDYDVLVTAFVKDFKHMFEIGEKLENINGVLRIEARQYLPLSDPKIPQSSPYGFFNPNLLDENRK